MTAPRPSVRFLLAWLAALAAADALFAWGPLPGGTISEAVREWHAARPCWTAAVYIGVAALGWHHFFRVPPRPLPRPERNDHPEGPACPP